MKFLQGLAVCLVLVSAVLISAVQAQNPTATAFRFWKPIDREVAQEEEIVAFTLDSEIYAVTRGGLPDLRVVDETQAEAPYLIESELEYRQELSRQPFHTNIVTLRPDGNAIEVHLRLPDKSPDADGFSFATPLRNYERKVRVSGSADGANWLPLVTDGIIFDYSQYMDVSSREITLPKNSFREFKITIEDVTDEKESPFKELTRSLKDAKEDQRVERTVIERRPFRIDRIGAWGVATRERVQQAKTVLYPVAGFDAKEVAEQKQTVVTVRTRREPITRFTLETPSRNFSRRAVVEVPVVHGVSTEWQPITEATIENFSFRNQNREQLTITIPERREEQFRIVIRNEDNPPLSVTGVQAEGTVQRVVFLAQPAKTYRLFYGSETAAEPKYEAVTVLTTLRQDNTPVMAKLGVQADNAQFGGEPSQTVRGLLNNWIFLGTALGLMVVVLGWCLFRAGRRLDSLPHE
jgi:Protein of unknown function (DUF3999)